MNNVIKIPNVYEALVQCPDRTALCASIQQVFRSQGWGSVVEDWFIPPPGNGMTTSQAALILSISTVARGALSNSTDLVNFDGAVQRATAKWAELQRVNRASKILTDYLR